MSDAQVQSMTLLPLASDKPLVMRKTSPSEFHLVIKEFLVRGDCFLRIQIAGGRSFRLSPESDGWQVFIDEPVNKRRLLPDVSRAFFSNYA